MFHELTDIAIESNGDILVLDAGFAFYNTKVFRINPLTGFASVVSSSGNLHRPFGIAIAPNSVTFKAPEIAITHKTLNIETVTVDSIGTETFLIKNYGDSTLTVSSISSNNSVFTVAPDSASISAFDSQVMTVTFSPIAAGSDSAIISITSDDSDEGTVTVSVKGTRQATTVAAFTVYPSLGNTATTFTFGASASTGTGLTYRWDFENDGTWDSPASGYDSSNTTTHQYSQTGTYTVKLEVRDSQNQTADTTKSVIVTSGGIGKLADTKVAFTSFRDGNDEIYVMNYDGSNQTRLTNNNTTDNYPSWSPDGSKIVFDSNRDGNSEIYVMDSDGSNPVNLTNNSTLDWLPSWSPDGSKIAFTSERDGNVEIYVMNSDGFNPVNLTNNSALDWSPSWSPDSSNIAFTSGRDGNQEVYVMNSDGSNPVNLTNNSLIDWSSSWSPDGSKIAFTSARDGNNEIYVMNSDGSNQTRLTNNSIQNSSPSWSPLLTPQAAPEITVSDTALDIGVVTVDSSGTGTFTIKNDGDTTLVVSSIRSDNSVFTVTPDSASIAAGDSQTVTMTFNPTSIGSQSATITILSDDSNEGTVTVSVTGMGKAAPVTGNLADTKIAFTSSRDGNWEIYVMDSDGSNVTRLTNNSVEDGYSSWSPDGSKIAFSSLRDGNREIYVMNSDGTNQTKLTNNGVVDASSSWSPDGFQIAFMSQRDVNQEIYVMNSDGSTQTNLTNNSSDDNIPS